MNFFSGLRMNRSNYGSSFKSFSTNLLDVTLSRKLMAQEIYRYVCKCCFKLKDAFIKRISHKHAIKIPKATKIHKKSSNLLYEFKENKHWTLRYMRKKKKIHNSSLCTQLSQILLLNQYASSMQTDLFRQFFSIRDSP